LILRAKRQIRGVTLVLALALPAVASPGTPAAAQGLGVLDAVRLALEHDPNIAIVQARLAGAQGVLLGAAGQFDPLVTSRVDQVESDTPLSESSSREERSLTSSVGVAQQFRTGLTVAPELGVSRVDVPGTGANALNVGTLALTFRQPLLQGRGRTVTTAGEMSAEREVAASFLDVEQTTSERVLAVVSQYWTVRARLLDLDILTASEQSSRDLLETTRRLVEADQTPAAELILLEANLAAKESSVIGGERALFTARQDLGREIGLEPARIASLPLPADPLPLLAPAAVPPPAEAGRFIETALRRRADVRAARERRGGAEILLRAADDALRPRLDLLFVPSWSGLVTGEGAGDYFASLGRNVPGANASLGFILSWPTRNRTARGLQAQSEAIRRQTELVIELISRGLGADVPSALDAVRSSALQVEKASEAVRLFERAVVNEEKKLRAGSSTLIDVISQRDRLTSARQTEVSAQLALALSLVRLRFETGTLFAAGEGEGGAALRPELLATVPSLEETRP
jgi:outer membrane protein TolC